MKSTASLLVLLGLVACGADEQRKLSSAFLESGEALEKPVVTTEYAPGTDAQPASNRLLGRLRADTSQKVDHFLLIFDELGLAGPDNPGFDRLPAFDFEFASHGDLLVPMTAGPVINEHPWWEFVLQPGRVWDEPGDDGWSRAAIPFALKEKREDCTHNGLMTFLYKEPGEVSQLAFQVTAQTCRYLQFDMSGLLPMAYSPGAVEAPTSGSAPSLHTGRHASRHDRLP